jgi:hypothetical protein
MSSRVRQADPGDFRWVSAGVVAGIRDPAAAALAARGLTCHVTLARFVCSEVAQQSDDLAGIPAVSYSAGELLLRGCCCEIRPLSNVDIPSAGRARHSPSGMQPYRRSEHILKTRGRDKGVVPKLGY